MEPQQPQTNATSTALEPILQPFQPLAPPPIETPKEEEPATGVPPAPSQPPTPPEAIEVNANPLVAPVAVVPQPVPSHLSVTVSEPLTTTTTTPITDIPTPSDQPAEPTSTPSSTPPPGFTSDDLAESDINSGSESFGNAQKIVIVEDNEALAEIYKTRMEILGYDCHVANDGETGLAMIQEILPDLVLLDMMIPKMAGDQILEHMRSSDWGKNIRVFIISNLNEADAPAGLRDLGIEGYAVKANLSNDQLDQLVDNILKPADQEEDIVLE